MKSRKNFEKVIVSITLLFIVLFSAEKIFPQCGNYFKTNYRAVNKISFTNSSYFLLADWTGDGKSDFWGFQANPNNSTQNILIYPSSPGGYWNWDSPIIYTTTIPTSVNTLNSEFVIKDFDSDGRRDILVSNISHFNDRIHRNTGNGSLTELAQIVLTSPAFMGTLGFLDLNGDNRLDWLYFASIHPTGQEIRYQLGNADGSFNPAVTIIAHTSQNNLNGAAKAIGDFNGDGKIDITYSNYIGGSTYKNVFLKNLGGGNFETGTPVQATNNNYLEVKDFNNDGKADILASTINSGRLVILYGQTDGTFIETEYPSNGVYFKSAELNGDGNLDVIEYDDTYYAAHLNNGVGGFSRVNYQKSLGRGPGNNLILEDFSGDNKADVYDSSHTSFNTFGEEVVLIKENICQSFGETKRANFDGGANADLAQWNPNTGDWRVVSPRSFFNGYDSLVSFNWGAGSLGDVPAPGDFDGDGKTDRTVYRNSTGEWYILQSSNGSWYVFKFGLTGDVPVPSDYDGGGKTDIAVFRPSDGNWYIWFSETQQFGAIHFGANGDKPVPEDYDGDGKTDVAVYRPSEGNWYYFKSSDQNVGIVHWGINTDKPLPADYDGDGKADLTVFRNGDWYILRSTNNSYNLIRWGISSDVPMPLYRDGDIAELVVYRPTNSYWYNYRYPDFAVVFGQSQYVPIYFGLPNN